ncbi:MAG: Amidohydrolase, partial [Acidimicrobiaceae bacterium]|nr:Amidohydrolase [Acidimicrobiaceae bacterium]
MERQRRLVREVCIADGRSPNLIRNMSILVEDGVISWIRPTVEEGELLDTELEIIDASGATAVPSMVDSHSHLTLAGGAHWIDRAADPVEMQLRAAEAAGERMWRAGIGWARDVGSITATDPADGRFRALALGVRDRWRTRAERPYIRAAGTWLAKQGVIDTLAVTVKDADDLYTAASRQIADGADLIKLYLDGPDSDVSPFSVNEIGRVVDLAHAHGVKVTGHSRSLAGAREGVDGGLDSLEHGSYLDADIVATMAARGTYLVSTVSALLSQ